MSISNTDIIKTLRRHPGIKASDIAKLLNVPRKDVNSALYTLKRRGLCEVNPGTYTWTIKKGVGNVKKQEDAPQHPEGNKVLPKATTSEEKTPQSPKSLSTRNEFDAPTPAKTKMKRPINIPYKPKSRKAEDLFEYAVKILAHKSQNSDDIFEPKVHSQWCNFCFGIKDRKAYERSDMMSLMHSKYSVYFTSDRKYTFDIEAIERDFPQFFEGYENYEDEFDAMLNAVKTELTFARNPNNQEKYKVDDVEKERNTSDIYILYLDLNDDDDPKFYEGINIVLKVAQATYYCKGIEYDMANAKLYVSCDKDISTYWLSFGYIYMDSSFILEAIYNRMVSLIETDLGNLPIYKFLDNETDIAIPVALQSPINPEIFKGLDHYQQEALAAALKNDLTFIWGPPGTGKSFTLASVIRTLFEWNDNTLVCCLSNVAVDQLLSKVVDLFGKEKIKPSCGEMYRAGRSLDAKIIGTDYLFLNDSTTKRLRSNIKYYTDRIEVLKRATKKEEASANIHECIDARMRLSDALKEHTMELIDSSKVIFSTIANFILTSELCEKEFDNLIVDEASMLSLPYLIAIAPKVAKRIIIVGDPQQLGPIAISPNKWLQQNVFDHCKVLEKEPPTLKQLLVQRRSHPQIVRLINKPFYKGRLKEFYHQHPAWALEAPFAGKVVHVINEDIPNDEVKYVGTTRRNFGTKEKVMDILNDYCLRGDNSFSIGVITPYRGQVKLYMGAINGRKKDATASESEFWENIKVGTIHTFQGSECDLIIIDIVEKAPETVGKLYHHEVGEQLVNVALSRAKHKLIIVGDTKRFRFGRGTANVSPTVSTVLGNLR